MDRDPSCNQHYGTPSGRYSEESAAAEVVQGYTNSVPEASESTGASPITDSGVEEDRGPDVTCNARPRIASGMANSGKSLYNVSCMFKYYTSESSMPTGCS